MRSLAPLDHVEVLYNGRVVARHGKKDATQRSSSGAIPVTESGWILLRAWNDEPDALIFDLYPYASTSPGLRVASAANPRNRPRMPSTSCAGSTGSSRRPTRAQDYNDAQEKKDTMDYLRAGRAVFEKKAGR